MTFSYEFWLITSIITVLFIIAFWFFRNWATHIDTKFDKLIKEVRELNKADVRKEEKIQQIIDHNSEQDKRINDHSERIRNIEIKTYKKDE